MDREQQMLQGWLTRLSLLDFAKLPATDQIDYILLRNDLEASLMRLGDRRDDAQELSPGRLFAPSSTGSPSSVYTVIL